MRLKRTIILISTLLTLLAGGVSAEEAEYIIVVHQDNPVHDLSCEELKRIFLGKKTRWADGSPITIIMNTNDEVHTLFTRTMLHKSPMQLSVYWKKILYSGTGMLPLSVRDDEAAKSYIGFHKHAIGYIASDSLDNQIKTVKVEDE